MANGNLYIVAAPSGAGKTSLVKALVASTNNIFTSISYTTRPMRPGEVDGKDYHFVDKNVFFSMEKNGDFIEYAEVFGNYYGTSSRWLDEQLAEGIDIILEIDWQGAQQVKKLFPNSTGIFILPPSRKTLIERLHNRGQDSEEIIQRRTQEAISEMSHYHEFDYLIINDDFQTALLELKSIINTPRLVMSQQKEKHAALINHLLGISQS